MENLSDLPNIGLKLAILLEEAGIKTEKDLKDIGSERAWLQLKAIDKGACLSKLYALEGAIQGIRWHDLTKARKEELKHFCNAEGCK